MKMQYESWRPNAASMALLREIVTIIDEFEGQGYILTLRQLFYQLVARDLVPNTERSYKSLGKMVTRARMAGVISWAAIEDRNRGHHDFWVNEDETDAIAQLPHLIRADRWADQEHYVEVWVEKEALGNVIAKACTPLFVPHMACKGYLSASEAWRAGQRFLNAITDGKQPVLIHLGDHDPSGIDMTRDNEDRLLIFTEELGVEVQRIALNMEQIEQFTPPPNPAKVTDSRAADYIRRYGPESWELDALEPQTLEQLITDAVQVYIDADKWNEAVAREADLKKMLGRVGERWHEIRPLLSNDRRMT